ncbi:ADP-ribosyltransferase, partial [Nocardia sp. JMUB6875]|uniref:ADP-ribosyltransferase n=1 Tax=Nocardia sp. JMUB6875 TaxID=3158170 RepID=UPI0034E86152
MLRDEDTSPETADRPLREGREPAAEEPVREADSTRREDGPAEERRLTGEEPRSDGFAPVHDEPSSRDADGRHRGDRPEAESTGRERDSHPSDRDRRVNDGSAPEDGFVVAPIPLGEDPEVRAHDGERRGPGERRSGDETPVAAQDRPEPSDRTESRRGAPPERTDGSKAHPGRLDDPSNTVVRDEESAKPGRDDPETVRERNRGRCGELALRLLRQITGNESIHPPQRRIGPEGMRLEELVAGAGGKLQDFPDRPGKPSGHDAIAERLRKLGDGASALVVDRYAGPVDEHGVGAHAYLLVNEGGEIVVKDPAAGLEHGFPPQVPRETKGVHAILFDSDGKPVHPLKDSVRAGLLHLADVHVGDAHRPPGDETNPDNPVRFLRESDEIIPDFAGASEYGREVWSDAHARMSDEQRAALRDYLDEEPEDASRPSASDIEAALRGEREMTPEIAEAIRNIDAALDLIPLPEPVMVTLSAGDNPFGVRVEDLPGTVQHLPGYVNGLLGPVPSVLGIRHHVELVVPAGTPALHLGELSRYGEHLPMVLMAHGLDIRIDSVESRGPGHYGIRGTVVPSDPAARPHLTHPDA